MQAKIYTPSDFPKPKPDQYRNEIIAKVEQAILQGSFTRTDKSVDLTILSGTSYYTQENLLDFNGYYAIHGKWSRVETTIVRKDSTNLVKISLFF